MGKFVAGIIIGIIGVGLGAYVYIHYGYMDFRADEPVGQVERFYMRGAMDHYAERHAPKAKSPVEPTDANLISGIQIYKSNCAVCHGGPDKPISDVGRGLYPRAPQFVQDAPDMPNEQNYWITKHGVRQTGMPAWDKVLSDEDIWKVTNFLGKMGDLDKASEAVQQAWKQGGQAQLGAQQNPTAPGAQQSQPTPAMPKKGGHQDTTQYQPSHSDHDEH